MDKIRIGIIGIGQRGASYVKEVLANPDCTLAAVCDLKRDRMEEFAVRAGAVDAEMFTDAEAMLDSGKIDACLVCVPDALHAKFAIAALKRNIHLILEKPMALTVEDCDAIIEANKQHPVVLQIGFVMREIVFYKKIHELIQSGELGHVMSIQADESLSVMHGASYMRRWHRYAKNCGGFIMAKCCHDFDIFTMLANSEPVRVASFGGLDFFLPRNDRPMNCSKCDDAECPYRFQGEFVVMTENEKKHPDQFDLCVFNADKDTVDNQQAIIEYKNGVKVSFSMNLFAQKGNRTMKVVGTRAYVEGRLEDNCLKVVYADGREDKIIDCHPEVDGGHNGGDRNLFLEFVRCIKEHRQPNEDFATGRMATKVALAIEKARRTHSVVEL